MVALVHRAFTLVAGFASEAENSGAEPVEALHTFLPARPPRAAGVDARRPREPRRVPEPLVTPITTALDAVLRRGAADGTIRPDASALPTPLSPEELDRAGSDL